MASNPPVHVEDHTDEDFFDKLVEDDVGPVEFGHDNEGINDSNDAKVFANLSIDGDGNDDDASENYGAGESGIELKGNEEKEEEREEGGVELEGGNAQEEDGFVVSSGSLGHADHGMGSSNPMNSSVDNSSGIPSCEVKQVDWNAFNAADSNGDAVFGSYSDFLGDMGDQYGGKTYQDSNTDHVRPSNEIPSDHDLHSSIDYGQYQEGQSYDACMGGNSTSGQDPNSSEYWESLYPGWRYDHSNGQWYQVDDHNNATTTTHGSSEVGTAVGGTAAGFYDKVEVSDMQQATQSIAGTLAESSASESVSSWNQVSQGNNGYPEHMYFDPQYPGWYYDTIAQEWRSLETYNSSIQGLENGHPSIHTFVHNDNSLYTDYGEAVNYESHGVGSQDAYNNWTGSYLDTHTTEPTAKSGDSATYGGYQQCDHSLGYVNKEQQNAFRTYGGNQQYDYFDSSNSAQKEQQNAFRTYGGNQQYDYFDSSNSAQKEQQNASKTYGGNQQFDHSFGSNISVNREQQNASSSFGSAPLYNNKANHGHSLANGNLEPQKFPSSGNSMQHFNYSNTRFDDQRHFSNDYNESKQPLSYSQQSFQGGHQHSFAPHAGRSSAGRPLHALVTFGFGGKLIVMKDSSQNLPNSTYGSQSAAQGSVSVLNLMEVVSGSSDSASMGNGTSDYFCALRHQSLPGPLVGGSVGSKELYKWIDERIAHCGSPDMDYRKAERLRLLFSLLKIACQHYGKLRSPFGTDTTQKEHDTPESAVAKLFASVKMSGKDYTQYGVLSHCLHSLPSEAQMRATASEVQNLLVSGKKKEALQYAQEGQLWGPALVLASQLGEKFYVDTVKQMALRQLVAGSPLRTLCLLIAGQPAEVFTANSSNSGDPAIFNMPRQPTQFESNGMLDDWEENLAVITANRTKDDELVIVHLGDSLWKERSQIIAAHICYLIAEANFESYSDSARLCLIGADHWKFPRTYATPEAIQRTELYEYSKVLGNSQFILLPFQPYKLIYAYMLAEVGKISDSMKYCQAVLKSLKTGRAPEVETWKQLLSSLEERIRTHQQGGYAANLAPAKLVGKLLNFFDSTAHRVVGGLPPPAPSSSQGTNHGNEQNYQAMTHRVSNSQSTMAMSSLVPSDSMEPISEWTSENNRMTKPNRSVSEPDFSRSPRQSSQEESSTDAQGKTSVSGGTSRFARFGFGSQFLQKTMGLVLRPRSDRQAKLGEKNKFYYDEKLKRWVEEGVDPPAEEPALAPPPTTAAFQNGFTEYNLKSALNSDGQPYNEGSNLKSSELTTGIPPIPPSTNQLSGRGRIGVRSRYVDTFNQGGGNAINSFQSPSVKPIRVSNAKFFIPSPAPSSSNDQTMEAIAENNNSHEDNENPSTSSYRNEYWSNQSPKQASSLQRFPSVGDFSEQGAVMMNNGNYSRSPHSRRTASWGGGSIPDSFGSPTKMGEVKSLGEALGMHPSTYMSEEVSSPMKSANFGDLHEVDL